MAFDKDSILNKVVLLWSGGVDSTAVLLNLIARGMEIVAVSSNLYEKCAPHYANREWLARSSLRPHLESIAQKRGAQLSFEEMDSLCLWEFALKGTLEIPQRNKRMLDLLMAKHVLPRGWKNVAMGEYVGVDTWVVQDHVPPNDCDHRALSSYMLLEYGITYRFMSLADFGESRFKSDRVALGVAAVPISALPLGPVSLMGLTTNCMADSLLDCGRCYKCVERHAAFITAYGTDPSVYKEDPALHPAYKTYLDQMQGLPASSSVTQFSL